MADDASHLLNLSNTSFSYPHVCPLPPVAWSVTVPPPPATGTAFLRDIHAMQEAVQAGITQDVRQLRLYRQWADFCDTLYVNPDLQDT